MTAEQYTFQFIIFLALAISLISIGWGITHINVKPKTKDATRNCLKCFWLQNSEDYMFCSNPNSPVGFLAKNIIGIFYCRFWKKRKDKY